MSTEERNKAVINEYFDRYWAKGDVSVVDELCTDDVIQHYPNHGARYGRAGMKKMLSDFREACRNPKTIHRINVFLTNNSQAFPDLTFRAYGGPVIAEGDYVAARWIGGGTHTGVAFDDLNVGKLDKPNTGKKIYFSGMTYFALTKDGKIKEEMAEEGGLQVMQQLGSVPGPNPGKEPKYDQQGDYIY
ncbi:NTF2-like protein [Rhizodiscina lignyota]|uniref:NTF2-like protein n=1 Tax=Rhizodiscina lignyota TaxID=1504668 RepID=A0A9P4ISH3_9PEZI|nr:NTF2-like protein [Rhizodiscina lignyota]